MRFLAVFELLFGQLPHNHHHFDFVISLQPMLQEVPDFLSVTKPTSLHTIILDQLHVSFIQHHNQKAPEYVFLSVD